MSKRTRTTFTKEFKDNAVRLLVDGNERLRDLSKRLGVSESVLGRWKREVKQAGPAAFPGKGIKQHERQVAPSPRPANKDSRPARCK